MKFGDFEIKTFVERRFKLDGGSMFGVVPKSIWSKMTTPDENNLIEMVTNLFVLKAHNKTFIFDTGLGDTLSDREKKIYGISTDSNMTNGLKSIGMTEDDIDYVILTHLHTDHSGGAVVYGDGEYKPRFQNATYIISNKEFEVATNPNERTSAVYIPERFYALQKAKQLELIDCDYELFPGIRLVHSGGHTEGHFVIEMESQNEKVFYYADIMMDRHHVAIPFNSASDIHPLDTMKMKREKLPEIVADKVIMAFDHDKDFAFAKIHQDGKKYLVEKVD